MENDTVNKIICKCLSLRDTILGVYVYGVMSDDFPK